MIPPPLTRLQLARYLICAPLYVALLLLVAEALLSATTTYLVIKVARDIANHCTRLVIESAKRAMA
jgi:hypothetical protein